MKSINVSDFVSSGQKVDSYEISGFDLVVNNQTGQRVLIKNGVSDVLVNNLTLPTTDGDPLDFKRILSAIPNSGVGFDSVYLEDMIDSHSESESSESNDNQFNVDLKSRQVQLKELLEKLEQQVEQKKEQLKQEETKVADIEKAELLKEEIEEREAKLEAQAQAIEEKLKEIEAASRNKDEQSTAEKLRDEKSGSGAGSGVNKPSLPQEEVLPSSDGDSDSASSPEPPSTIVPPTETLDIFISGGLSKDSDSGKAGDGITNISKPTFEGKTLPDVSVSLTIGGTVYSFKSDSTGAWSFTLPNALPNGEYDYEVSATDKNGNQESSSGSLTVDTNAATLTDISWFNSDTDIADIVNEARPTLKGHSAPGANITLVIDGKSYTTVANESGEWSIAVGHGLPDGEFSYKLTASTVAGSEDAFEGVVLVDTSIDTTYFSLDSAQDSGEKNDFITNSKSPSFTGQTEAGANVVVTINGHSYNLVADKSGTWTFDTPELPDGQYDIEVSITDSAGNHLTQTSSIVIDTVVPETNVIISRDDDSIVDGNVL
ncbi:Ig-like domain-containing protein, partial [Vibrio owensii]|uniref:Ig-like domain-containing protein n=1 Tax=Vibrio owensii TaxID=696485 RepID=UPI003AAAC416